MLNTGAGLIVVNMHNRLICAHECTPAKPREFAPIRRSGAFLREAAAATLRRIVTQRDRWGAAYAGLPLDRWDPQRAGLPGLSLAARCPMTAAAPSTARAAIQPAVDRWARRGGRG